jgi:hypothetical protein
MLKRFFHRPFSSARIIKNTPNATLTQNAYCPCKGSGKNEIQENKRIKQALSKYPNILLNFIFLHYPVITISAFP